MSWHERTLGSGIHIKHGFAFKSRFFSNTGKYIVLTPGNFYEKGGFRLRPGKDRFYNSDVPNGFVLQEGDLIVAMTEQGPGLLGSSAIIPENDKFLHNQRLGLIDDLDENIFDKRFLYYLFNTRSVRGQISGSASGTKVHHTSPERIYRVRVTVPDSDTQREIANTLSTYDDLIENNRRRIALLEKAARLLYKEWFARLRFPGHEHVKIIDGVPEGWEARTVGDMAAMLKRGITPKYEDDASGTVINQKCIRNRLVNLDLARAQAKRVPTEKLLRFGDVLINSTGEGTLGRVAQFFYEMENCTVDSHVTIARAYDQVSKFYFGMVLANSEDYLAVMGRGATNQTELSPATIAQLPFLVPPDHLVITFETFSEAVFSQIVNLVAQIKKLRDARDLLLPRLMNGEIAV